MIIKEKRGYVIQTPIEVPSVIGLVVRSKGCYNIAIVPSSEQLYRYILSVGVFDEVRFSMVAQRSDHTPISYFFALIKQRKLAGQSIRDVAKLYYSSYINDFYTSSLVAYSLKQGIEVIKIESALDSLIPGKRSKSVRGMVKCLLLEIIFSFLFQNRWHFFEKGSVIFAVFSHQHVKLNPAKSRHLSKDFRVDLGLEGAIVFFMSPLENGVYGANCIELTKQIIHEFSQKFDVVIFPHPRESNIDCLANMNVRIIHDYVPASMVDVSKAQAVISIESAALKEVEHKSIYSFAKLQRRYDSGDELLDWLQNGNLSPIMFADDISNVCEKILKDASQPNSD